jgi:hypothetical protein
VIEKRLRLFDQVMEARGEYDRAQRAFEKANNDLYDARQKWERLYQEHQAELLRRAQSEEANRG